MPSSTLRPPPLASSYSTPSTRQYSLPPSTSPRAAATAGLSYDSSASSADPSDSSDSSDSSSPPLHHPVPQLHPSSFAPPFYNRPSSIKLPPSPSLTSLLRPAFTPSRPTTPDSSDSEAVATSSRIAQSTPRYAPKVPTYEYYGFVLYVVSTLSFGVYLVWSFAPAELLHDLGVHKAVPSRWWSLALPAWVVMAICYVYVALAAYNTEYLTKGLDAVECLVDEAANVAAVRKEEDLRREEPDVEDDDPMSPISPISPLAGTESVKEEHPEGERTGESWDCRDWAPGDWRRMWSRGTDAVMDIPVGGVCEVLYGDGRDREQWEFED